MATNDWYALLAPLFALLVGVEAWIARRRGLRVYRLADTLSNLGCGLGQVMLGVLTGGLVVGAYAFGLRFAVVHPPPAVAWPLAFVGVDLCYYVWHRAQHRVAALWAIHAVHHQSEELNLSVALRQPFLSDFTAMPFYAPLPLLGVPTGAFFVAVAALSAYQVLLHTRLVDGGRRWGRVFNTPAHHRLHHARDAEYLDCNFGATLFVWDRLLGTAARETRAPTYGTPSPPGGHGPLWAQVQPALALVGVRRAPSPPRPATPLARAYAVAAFALTTVGGLALFQLAGELGRGLVVAGLAVTLAGTATPVALVEGRRWAWPVETVRLAALAAIVAVAR